MAALSGRARTVGYWVCTVICAWELTSGSMWDLLRIEFTRAVFAKLGYPSYLLLIIGAWKLPGALALLVPRFPRLKEWAYAGAFFNYTGAVASHLLVGEGPKKWVGPLVFAAITMASWALRPPDRRLAPPPASETRLTAWLVPVGAVAAMVALALLTLPKGADPY